MTLPRLYLCGPMTGLPDENYPAFHEAAAQLRAAGYTVVNPAETDLPKGLPWMAYMRAGVIAMMQGADALACLPGFLESNGAYAEFTLANQLKWKTAPVDVWLEQAEPPDAQRIRADLIGYLQRDLLATLKRGPSGIGKPLTPNDHNTVLDLRSRIHALNPDAALYFNHGGPRPWHIQAQPIAADHDS